MEEPTVHQDLWSRDLNTWKKGKEEADDTVSPVGEIHLL